MKRTRKRQELIQVGRDIIVRQGFNATGLSDILTTAAVPKGSFYYYFESKEDFGLAIIEDFAKTYQTRLDETIGNKSLSPDVRLNRYFELGIQELEENQYETGCLIGNLSQELATQNELFRDRLNQILDSWETQFADCIKDFYSEKETTADDNALELARFVLSGWQGAILRSKTTRSVEPLNNFTKIFFEQILQSQVPSEHAPPESTDG